jgi:hypothetical protein
MQKAKKSNEEPIEDNSTETVAPSGKKPKQKTTDVARQARPFSPGASGNLGHWK